MKLRRDHDLLGFGRFAVPGKARVAGTYVTSAHEQVHQDRVGHLLDLGRAAHSGGPPIRLVQLGLGLSLGWHRRRSHQLLQQLRRRIARRLLLLLLLNRPGSGSDPFTTAIRSTLGSRQRTFRRTAASALL